MPDQPTIYISGPMTGYVNHNRESFEHAAMDLKNEGWVVVTPLDLDVMENVEVDGDGWTVDNEQYESLLSRDLELIDSERVSAMVFLPGWPRSGGAGREGRKAIEQGIQLYLWEPRLPGHLVKLAPSAFLALSTTKRPERA